MPKIVKDEEIYNAVIQIISERGYAGATIKQMADAANVSEMTLFRKYGTKQQLVKKAISSIIRKTELASSAQYSGDIEADLLRIVQAYQDSAVKHGGFVAAIISEVIRYPELVDSIDEPMKIFSTIGELIARYQDEGQMIKEYPLHAMAVLLGPLMYTTMMSRAMSDIQMPPLDLYSHVSTFLAGRQPENDT
ncbi:MAG: TetR/AcrR family transcriptional regulator [Anaerolineaceae bacterium]|nr:TetR/AcrR family transcriptional regulator [Anaerolineaceae bacterium]